MAQIWNDNTYQGNHIIDTDMTNIESNFECLKSNFSGASTPANADESGMIWYETDQKINRSRNYATSGWLCLLPLDSNQRIWHYRNDAPTGLIVDGTITDRVLAVAATSGYYNLTPGNSSAWYTLAHTHGDGTFTINTLHRHQTGSGGGYIDKLSFTDVYSSYAGSTAKPVTGSSASGGPASTWRPSAAVGVLLKLNI